MDLLKDILRVWAMQREFRAVLADLNSRSDRELKELGLARGDIARVAWEEAERRILGPAPSRPEPPTRRGGTLPWCRVGTGKQPRRRLRQYLPRNSVGPLGRSAGGSCAKPTGCGPRLGPGSSAGR